MAAHFGSNIRRYVGGNHLSSTFSQLSVGRPSMGARFCSTTPTPSLPPSLAEEATRPGLRPLPVLYVGAILFSFGEWMDFKNQRSEYQNENAEVVRKWKALLEAELKMVRREIETLKSGYHERTHDDANIAQEAGQQSAPE